ncbi:HEPN domain-containing protein [Picosynechococcus sp. NKBG042902]|uniref:HEPN domain-containing protein n=1 Tax=Picosynechococcus sp. NKBG042902 TaxID=490193 RepID=UPI0004AA3484|nr:HEPN domain-containing protein [Picosynechococcus sp. NKBG042902]
MTANGQLQLLVRYRLQEADETLREAKLLLEQSAFRGSINRSYYAMFYALLGLLATKGLGTSKHSGIISLFDREFVKTGIFRKELSKSLHRAFDERQANDYGEMLEPDLSLAEQLFQQAQVFVAEIKQQLAKVGFEL